MSIKKQLITFNTMTMCFKEEMTKCIKQILIQLTCI